MLIIGISREENKWMDWFVNVYELNDENDENADNYDGGFKKNWGTFIYIYFDFRD